MPLKKHSEQICCSLKNRKSKEKCGRYALINSEYCGYHVKNPVRYVKPTDDTLQNSCIIKIQRAWRYAQLRLRGPALDHREFANNEEDFCSFDLRSEIPRRYFFSYLDSDGFIYCFDTRSLFHLIDNSAVSQNPYNRHSLSSNILKKLEILRKNAIKTKLNIYYETVALSAEEQLKSNIVDLFQKIDNLDFYTDIDWFMRLDVPGLKLLYQTLFTMFTIRSGLTKEQQRNIVPLNPFKTKIAIINQNTSKLNLQQINLNTMQNMISSSTEHNNQKLAALYVIMSFVYIDKRAAKAYPYLIQ